MYVSYSSSPLLFTSSSYANNEMLGINLQRTVKPRTAKAPTLPHAVKAPSTPITVKNNPYKVQRQWPPDFTKLHPKFQFRLERRYRRRAKMKYQRPGWIRGVKLATWGSCSCWFSVSQMNSLERLTFPI